MVGRKEWVGVMNVTKKMLLDHAEALAQMKKFKKLELELRNKIISKYQFDAVEGVQKKTFETKDFVANIEIGLKITRKLDADAVESLWSTMTENERALIKYNPALDLKEYRHLLELDGVGKLHQAIIETPAQPTIKVSICD